VGLSLVIFEDTRNKPEKNVHIREQLEALGYEVKRTKIYCGDYTFPTNQSICIDTKQDLQEVVGNVIQQHERFRDECIRAKEAGIQLIILITEPKVTCLADVFGWYNPRLRYSKKATTGRQLGKILYSMKERYGVDFQFVTKDRVGQRIVELLEGR
jgi:ribosome-associated protein